MRENDEDIGDLIMADKIRLAKFAYSDADLELERLKEELYEIIKGKLKLVAQETDHIQKDL